MNDYQFWDELGNIFNAVLAYQQKTIEFNKRFVTPWIQLGGVFDPQDDNAKALSARKQAIDIDPENAGNFVALGDVYFKMGWFDDAANAYARAIELNPRAGWAHANLALIHATRQNFEEAIRLYRQSLELTPDQKDRAMIWNRLGNAYRRINDYENACVAFQMADECDAGNTGFTDQLDSEPVSVQVIEGDGVAILPSEMPQDAVMIAPEDVVEQAVEVPSEQTAVAEADVEAVVDPGQPEVVAESMATGESVVAEVVASEASTEEVAEPAAEEVVVTEVQWVSEEQPVAEESAVLEATLETVDIEEAILESTEAETATETQDAVMQEQETIAQPEPSLDESITETTITPVPVHETESIAVAVTMEETQVVIVAEPESAPAAVVEVTPSLEFVSENQVEEVQAQPEAEVESAGVMEPVAEVDVQPAVEDEAAPVEEPVAEAEIQTEAIKEANVESNESIIQEIITLVDNNGVNVDEEMPDFLKQEALEATSNESVTAHASMQIEPDTKNAYVWNELGNVYFDTGAYEEAISAYTKAIELDVRFAWPYSNLALAYVQKEKYDEAVLLYQRSIELFATDKDKAVTFNRLGNVYRRMNNYDNAIASYQRADELDPNNATRSLRSRFSLLGALNMEQSPNLAN